MTDIIATKKIEDLTINITFDESPENPREWDNLGKMLLFSKKYSFPKEAKIYSDDYNSWDEMQKDIIKKYNALVVLPVYLYDHSGLSFSVKSFQSKLPQGHAEFDSSQIGFIFATKKDICKQYGKTGNKEIEKATEVLINEVEIYGKYANGEIFMFTIKDEDGEELNNWGGYYSIETAMENAELSASYFIDIKPTRDREKLEKHGQLAFDFNY